jgi:hypothetical protein
VLLKKFDVNYRNNTIVKYNIMKLSDLKKQLSNINELTFMLPNGSSVAKHFHVTEVGQVTKHFIDCGGTVRNEKVVSFQLWEAEDVDHRLEPGKLLGIINLSEKVLGVEDAEIEVEYQGSTISKYGLAFTDQHFMLTTKHTACLASDSCGNPTEKKKIALADLTVEKQACCIPGGKCC